jgi:hypothetical protein
VFYFEQPKSWPTGNIRAAVAIAKLARTFLDRARG